MHAISMIKKWTASLDRSPGKAIDFNNPKDDSEKVVIKVENEAKMGLTLDCEGVEFEYIIGKTTAYEIYNTSLKNRYESEEVDDYLELIDKFQECKITKEADDPEKWFHK